MKRFGSWSSALEAADLAPSQRSYWSDEDIVTALQDWTKQNGRAPRISDWVNAPHHENFHRPTAATVTARFGSWQAALEAGGIELPKRSTSAQDVLAAITRQARDRGRPPSFRMFRAAARVDPSHPAEASVKANFGSWNAALKAAGFKPLRRDWSRTEIVEAFGDFERRNGRPPTVMEWDEPPSPADAMRPSAETIRNHFGTWRAALLAANLKAPPKRLDPQRWTRDTIVAAFLAHREKTGRTPSSIDWRRAGTDPRHPNSVTVERYFGSWTGAVSAAGLTPTTKPWSRDEVIEALRLSAKCQGAAPSAGSWRRAKRDDEPPRPSYAIVLKRFGSWRTALNAAGLL